MRTFQRLMELSFRLKTQRKAPRCNSEDEEPELIEDPELNPDTKARLSLQRDQQFGPNRYMDRLEKTSRKGKTQRLGG